MSEPKPIKVVLRPVDALIPYARNARKHSDEQIAQIAASITEFGWTNPILVDGENGIIAGHGRLLAARKLGLKKVPVIELGHLTHTQKQAYILADNKLTENAGWDLDMLRVELEELDQAGVDLALTGFNPDEIKDLFESGEGEEKTGNTDDDAAPEPEAAPITRLGDLWILGPHRLLCGDALAPKSYETLMADGPAHMVITDPPYNVNYGSTKTVKSKNKGGGRKIINDHLGAGFPAFLLDMFNQMLPNVKGALYVCMSTLEIDALQAAFRAAGGHFSTFIIWVKNTFVLGAKDYHSQYEQILYGCPFSEHYHQQHGAMIYGWTEGERHYWCGDRDQGDVWFINKPAKNDLHPTMKPVELVLKAIKNSSKPKHMVLDPFCGSGTVLIACEKVDRQARAMELDPKYVDVAIRRWQDWTGQAAELAGSGKTFAQVQAERTKKASSSGRRAPAKSAAEASMH